MRQHVADNVHRIDGKGPILHAHVNVHAEDEQPAGQHLHLFQHAQIAGVGRDRLLGPAAKGMGRCGHDGDAVAVGQIANELTLLEQFLLHLFHRAADGRPQFHHGLMELRLHLALHEDHFVPFDQLGDIRAQLPGFRIDDLVFFLNAQGEGWSFNHASFSVSPMR